MRQEGSTVKTEYTPGPWLLDTDPKDMVGTIAVYKDFGDEEMTILAEVDNTGNLPGEANARLIKAAPKMLEALRAVVRGAEDELDLVYAAIEEAETGEATTDDNA